MSLSDVYTTALGFPPYPYQRRLAESDWPDVLEIPTGLGKTAAIFLAWMYKRSLKDAGTPRRLVWCLPMRVLVEQTARLARQWGERLAEAGLVAHAPAVHVLMGGDIARDWDARPEDDAVLIGTQDQLLSRALNRGYAMSRFRWPLDFALLHNDAFWVFDEIQLMGAGLSTSTQLEAFRRRFSCAVPCRSLWCSATLHPDWLKSVDFAVQCPHPVMASLEDDDKVFPQVQRRIHAAKKVEALEAGKLVSAVLDHHRPGTLTLVIRNTVKDAEATFRELKKKKNAPPVTLLHSRFRPADRAERLNEALAATEGAGRIVVTTQVVEAGVDISADVLFTDLAPWSSLVQRFGRCNRNGTAEDARIFWLQKKLSNENAARPYSLAELTKAQAVLGALSDASPALLPRPDADLPEHAVLRAPDLFDLFDTTPDLAGADIDVSPYIRESDDTDAQVFWRDWEGGTPPDDMPSPSRQELCPVPIASLQEFLQKKHEAWLWDTLDGAWSRVRFPRPGMVLLLRCSEGGYLPDMGWSPEARDPVSPVEDAENSVLQSSLSSDPNSRMPRQTITQHGEQTCEALKQLLSALNAPVPDECLPSLLLAALRHDWGKAHAVFQDACLPEDRTELWAKAPHMQPYARPGFRHELASALALLQTGGDDLAAYLAAAHHGKIRLSLRSLPNETPAPHNIRFARGLWEGDELPAVKDWPAVRLSLACMELGRTEAGESWADRMTRLLEIWGPFRLAFWESLIRLADWRASAEDNGHVRHSA